MKTKISYQTVESLGLVKFKISPTVNSRCLPEGDKYLGFALPIKGGVINISIFGNIKPDQIGKKILFSAKIVEKTILIENKIRFFYNLDLHIVDQNLKHKATVKVVQDICSYSLKEGEFKLETPIKQGHGALVYTFLDE